MSGPTNHSATGVAVLAEDPDLMKAALQLAADGLRVLPLHSPDPDHRCSCHRAGCESVGKHPRTQHGVKDASTDDGTIRRWWGMWPDANIGIATGDGLVVLDVDPRHDGDSSLETLEAEHAQIITRSAWTGGGGLHLYLQGDLPARGAFLPGLDLKAAGGYVVAPPSKHASGRQYSWVDVGEGIRVVPDWLAKIVNSATSQNVDTRPLPDTIPSGERNKALASLAGSMRRRGASEASIHAALKEQNRSCDPPLSDNEVGGIAASVARYEPAPAQSNLAAVEGDAGVSLRDFYAYMPEHKYIFVPARELWPVTSVNARLPTITVGDKEVKAGAWLDQERPVEQMTWAPGKPRLIKDRLVSSGGWIIRTGCSCFNLYRPPSPRQGSAQSAQRWLDLIGRVFPDDAEHIVRYCAHRVQKPYEKINHALVLGGPQGIGKDTILEPVKHAVGPWNFTEVSPAQLLGRFNGFVKSVILRVSEARDLGNVDRYAFYEHMKSYTAAPPDVLRCDEKNIREYSVFNVCGVVITTNHKSAGIYLPSDDRRHYVAWSELTRDDFTPEFWKKLYDWYEQEGHGHVAAHLADLDISDFNAKAPPPKTAAFWDIVDANRAPEDAELADVLDKLGHPPATSLIEIAARAEHSFREWLLDRKNRRQIPHRLEAADYVHVRNEFAKDGLWVVSGKRQVIYARRALSVRERIIAAASFAAGGSP